MVFLFALLQPAIPNPLQLEPATAWTLLCYAFAVPTVLLHCAGGHRWQMTPFDWALCAYLVFVLVTWPTSFNRQATSVATFRLFGQVAVFCAIRLLASGSPAVGRVVVAAFIVGVALLEWIATDFHLRYGLSERLLEFPSLEWNGRTGLGYAGAIELALLVGIWQQTRSWKVQLCVIVLMAVGVAELIFFYTRASWIAAAAVLLLALVMAVRIGGVRRYALALGIVVAVIGSVSTPVIVHLAKTVAGLEQGREVGFGLRLGAWRDAVSVIRQHPFVGVGLGNYVAVHIASQLSSPSVVLPGQLIHPHNIFLQQIAEIGIPGGLAYVALWATAHRAGWQTSIRNTHVFGTTLSVFYALVAITVVNLGENMFLDVVAAERVRLHTFAWILMAVVTAAWNRARPSDGQPWRTSGKR